MSASLGATPPCITFVHGFTQTSRSWDAIRQSLEPTFVAAALDAPGHGENTNGKLSLPQCGDFIASAMTPGILVGYSMGARMALHAALQHPATVQALVLISGTPGIEDDNERANRKQSDDELAAHIEDVGVPQFIQEWLSNSMFNGLSEENRHIADRLRNSSSGLADSLRYAGTGTQTPLWSRLQELNMPVLLVTGEKDQKFTDIAERMNDFIPASTLHVVPHVGHTVHLEAAEEFTRILRDFASSMKR